MSSQTPISLDASLIAAQVEENIARLSCTLRPDYLAALKVSVATEQSERGRVVLEQLLENARIASAKALPLCQDTGYVWVCLELTGSDISVPSDVFSLVDDAVARAYKANGLRMSMVQDALVNRANTGDNTPVFCEVLCNPPLSTHSAESSTAQQDESSTTLQNQARALPVTQSNGTSAVLHIMLKGGGSDNASALTMLPPGSGTEGVLDTVVEAVAAKGANACPPLVIGVGVGGSFDKVASLAKHALLRPIGSTHPIGEIALLEKRLLERINALGIGPGGLGGSTTALAVHIKSAPCHIAALPVAVNIGCTALRSVSIPL